MSDMIVCPPGFDCAFYNSCPSFNLSCPAGYFCSSYQGFAHQSEIDYRYAKLHEMYSDNDVSYSNKENYIDPQRTIQSRCVLGFYCDDELSMDQCPSGHWCSENTVEPFQCTDLSSCTAAYAVDFTNLLLALLFIIATLVVSISLRKRQHYMNEVSRKRIDDVYDNNGKHPSTTTNHTTNPSEDSNGIEQIEIEFQNAVYSVKDRQGVCRDVLPGVSGHIPGAKFTLMLGTTGCGKTTWLKMLRYGGQGLSAGQVTFHHHTTSSQSRSTHEEGDYNEIHSILLEHSSPSVLPRSLLSRYVGYVPQEDIVDRDLTVRELLLYHSLARQPIVESYSSMVEQAHQTVNRVLKSLDISHIADSIIGGGENQAANISGGQLKRVNIACELVALTNPAVLLLDEPTGGLDASVAYDLIIALKALCLQGTTIISVLQQPRPEIFTAMDHLFLMSQDGSIIYEGKPGLVSSHLTTLGFVPYSVDTSDADFCIDVLNQMKELESETVGFEVETHRVSIYESPLSNQDLKHTRQREPYSHSKNMQQLLFWTYLNINRLVLIRFRNLPQLLVNISIHLVMAVALSSGFSILITESYLGVLNPPVSSPLRPYYPSPVAKYADRNVSDLALNQLLFFMSGALGCAASLASVPVFARQHSLASREKDSGISILAYSFGRIIGDIYFVLLNGFVFAGAWCAFGMSGEYNQWLSVILATSFAASGIGYLSSVLCRHSNNSSVYAVIFTFVCCVFSGSEPALEQVNKYYAVSWPWYLSFGTWTSEATYVTWTGYLSDQGKVPDTVADGAQSYGYEVSEGLGRAVGALIAIGILFRFLSIFGMWRSV